jgi:hypothetical protein
MGEAAPSNDFCCRRAPPPFIGPMRRAEPAFTEHRRHAQIARARRCQAKSSGGALLGRAITGSNALAAFARKSDSI